MPVSQPKSFQSPEIPESSVNNDLWFVFAVLQHIFKENIGVKRTSSLRSHMAKHSLVYSAANIFVSIFFLVPPKDFCRFDILY